MPVIGRTRYASSNIIKRPPKLPITMYLGTVTWSLNFQGFPSGTISYSGVPEQEIKRFEQAYNFRKPARTIKIKWYGIDFVVNAYGYKRVQYVWRGIQRFGIFDVTIGLGSELELLLEREIKVFTLTTPGSRIIPVVTLARSIGVSYSGKNFDILIPKNADKDYAINLRSVLDSYAKVNRSYVSYSDGITVTSITRGTRWDLSAEEVTTDGENVLQDFVAYNNVELSWGQEVDEEEDPEFKLKEPEVFEIFQQDKDVELPPEGTEVLRDVDSNADISGEKKVRRRTVQVNGQTDIEEIWTYGFAYTASEIDVGNGLLFTDEPELYWKLISYQKTQYIYKRIQDLSLTVLAKDPSSPDRLVSLFVHPDYAQFANVTAVNGSVNFESSVKYLVQIATTGWRLMRFDKEGRDKYITLEPDNPLYSLYFFKRIPFNSNVLYELQDSRSLFDENSNLPFSVQWLKLEDLEPEVRSEVRTEQITASETVGVLFPDPNFVEPMTVLKEDKRNSSFAFTPHPESTLDDPKPPYVTGEESKYLVERTIVNKNFYKEKITEFSTQNSGFSDVAEKIYFQDMLGRPGQADTRKTDWEQVEQETEENVNNGSRETFYINSDESRFINEGGELNYAEARSQEQAIASARTELEIAGMQQDQSRRDVFSFYPNMRDGDRVFVGEDRFRRLGTWRIMSVSWTLSFDGTSPKFGLNPVCRHEGTSLSLGLQRIRTITVRTNKTPNSDSLGNGDPELEVSGGVGTFISTIDLFLPNRRKF